MGAIDISEVTRAVTPPRPSWGVYESRIKIGRSTLRPGVYFHDKRGDLCIDEWLATPVQVAARIINVDDGSHGRLIRYSTPNGSGEWTMPMELLAGSGEEIRRELLRRGAVISTDNRCRMLFTRFLADVAPAETLSTTAHIGWHKNISFVLPSQTIGDGALRFAGNMRAAVFATAGNLQSWQQRVALLCTDSPILMLSVSIAFAGPLLQTLQINGGGLHLVGKSSSGKSLAQLVAASVWGQPSNTGFVSSWETSRAGVETLATPRSDTLLVLDEISRVDSDDVQRIVYALANGQGRATMSRDRSANPILTWRLLFLSSGERTLAEHAALSGNPAHAGAELRLIDVYADRKYGVFDTLHGRQSGEELHLDLTRAVQEQHGIAGPAFVRRLMEEPAEQIRERFRICRRAFEAPNSQAARVADRFALIATAGELATSYGVTPWQPGEALGVMRDLYSDWLERLGSGEAEDRRVLRQIRDFIDRHGSRFSDLGDGRDVSSRAGYIQRREEKILFLFNRSGLSEACPGLGTDRVVRILAESAVIAAHDRDRLTKKIRAGGRLQSLYVIDPELLP